MVSNAGRTSPPNEDKEKLTTEHKCHLHRSRKYLKRGDDSPEWARLARRSWHSGYPALSGRARKGLCHFWHPSGLRKQTGVQDPSRVWIMRNHTCFWLKTKRSRPKGWGDGQRQVSSLMDGSPAQNHPGGSGPTLRKCLVLKLTVTAGGWGICVSSKCKHKLWGTVKILP